MPHTGIIEYMKSILAIAFLLFPLFALAQSPSVSYFNVDSSSINSGGAVGFSWQIANGGGYSFQVLCSTGIKFKNQNGSMFTCDTPVSSLTPIDSRLLIIANVSGGTKSFTARITPKDLLGADYSPGARSATVSVGTSPQPITSFTANPAITIPGQAITLNWTSPDLDGVNINFECRDEIRVSSPSYTASAFMPCGKPVFSTDLSGNSSLTLNLTNSSRSSLPYAVTLLPAISQGSYDGIHSASLTLTVASDVIPDPSVTSFTASTTTVNSGEGLSFTWITENSSGVNFIISCAENVSATSSAEVLLPLPCNIHAFSSPLTASGAAKFYFVNKGIVNQSITLTLLPIRKSDGLYDATRGKALILTVRREGAISLLPPAPVPAPLPPPPPVSPPIFPPASIKSKPLPVPSLPQRTPSSPTETTGPGLSGETPALEGSTALGSEIQELRTRILQEQKIKAEIASALLAQNLVEEIEFITPVAAGALGLAEERYEVTGRKKVKLFFLIPVRMTLTIEVMKSGLVLTVKKPWWSFLAR